MRGLTTASYSLRRRLLLGASLTLVIFLGLMGLALNKLFENSVLANAEDALQNQILLLIADVDVDETGLILPSVFSEPRLGQPERQLLAAIFDDSERPLWQSRDDISKVLGPHETTLGEFQFFADDRELGYYQMTLAVEWEYGDELLPLQFVAAERITPYRQQLRQYRQQLALWLASLGAGSMVLLLLLLSYALAPLARITQQVRQVESGKRDRFDEDYPLEVSRLTKNLNQLLNFEQQRIDRQKQVLKNLAHSLKTPVAVLSGLRFMADEESEGKQQIETINRIIEYQLQSGAAVGRRRFSKPFDIAASTKSVLQSMTKLYADKALEFSLEIEPNTIFYGDQGDWLELIGNLLDNACKWAKSKVVVNIRNFDDLEEPPELAHRRPLQLDVIDDGDGIDSDERQLILQRGVRLDSQIPGHGLGLHIVKSIVEAYDGQIAIEAGIDGRGSNFRILLR